MGSPALIDTNLLIDFLGGVPQAHAELASYTDRAISVISRIELLVGTAADELVRTETFLSRFQLIELTPEIAQETIIVRRKTRLKLPDAILLATAHVEGRILLTRNTKDFAQGRFVRIPYEI